MRTLKSLTALAGLLAVTSCTPPPPSAYVNRGAAPAGDLLAVGDNSAGEACSLQRLGDGGEVFCGNWTSQPSARIHAAPASAASDLDRLVADSPWRAEIDQRLSCGTPRPGQILGGTAALVMTCTRRSSGFGVTALAAAVHDRAYLADSVDSALPAVERAIGVLSGKVAAGDARSLPSNATALLAERAAAAALSANDLSRFDELVRRATDANRAGESASAEQAWRDILTLQHKAHADDAAIGTSTMALALQLSNQTRFKEAKSAFDEADRLLAGSLDVNARGRLLLYRGIDQLNQHQPTDALPLFDQAEADFALLARGIDTASAHPHSDVATGALTEAFALRECDINVQRCSAVAGLIEVKRNRAWAYRLLNRPADSDAEASAATRLALDSHLTQAPLLAYVFRTGGVSAANDGNSAKAVGLLDDARAQFRRLPVSRPLAETDLRAAAAEFGRGNDAEGLRLCRQAIALMKERRDGVDPILMDPCLAGFAQAGHGAQPVLAEMFEAAQLTRGSITARDVQTAAVRLAENASNPKVSEALRRNSDSKARLADLQSQRLALAGEQSAATAAHAAELDEQIARARQDLAQSENDIQAQAPNYGQLVQAMIPSSDVLAALRPGEAFVSTVLAPDDGWVFLLRDNTISVGRIDGGQTRIAELVKRFRVGAEVPPDATHAFDTVAAEGLFQAVLGPIDAGLRDASALTVAPTGPLLSVPFAALLTGPAQPDALDRAPWLIRRFPIAHTPAASNFVAMRRAGPSHAPRSWIGFGDFRRATLAQVQRSFGPECGDSAQLMAALPLLAGTRQELVLAARATGAAASDQYLDAAFTTDTIRKLPLSQYRIVHFATHAILPTELACLAEPSVVTSTPASAPDASAGLLSASMVQNLQLDADAVLLSACNTGGPGGSAAAESLSGLARSFFYAGARALLITHWEADDSVASAMVPLTLDLMGAQKMGLSAALREVQLKIIDDPNVPGFAKNPYYWAPYAVIGEGGVTAHPQSVAAN